MPARYSRAGPRVLVIACKTSAGYLSGKATGATEANFIFDRTYVTANSAAGVEMFKSMGCTLSQGLEADVTASGCGFIPGAFKAPVEFDLLQVRNGNLFLGDRSTDLTKARPEKLGAYPLVRR